MSRAPTELHRLALLHMRRERQGHTLQPTALVNEAYLRLIKLKAMRWQDRAHFLAMAARVMRRVLVDFARARRNQKRGGGMPRTTFDEALPISGEPGKDLVALDDALVALETRSSAQEPGGGASIFRRAQPGGTAVALDVSIDTVKRDWRFAKLWLLRELGRR